MPRPSCWIGRTSSPGGSAVTWYEFLLFVHVAFAIIWIGGGVLGWVAAEMILKDPIVAGWLGTWATILHWLWPGLMAVFVTFLGWWWANRSKTPEAPAGTAAGA